MTDNKGKCAKNLANMNKDREGLEKNRSLALADMFFQWDSLRPEAVPPTINSDFCLVYIIHEASKQNVILENHVNCAQTIPGRVSRGRYQQKYI